MPDEPKKNRGGRPIKRGRDQGMTLILQRAGSMTNLASALGVTVGAVSQWMTVPRRRVDQVAATFGIAPELLLPPDGYSLTPKPGSRARPSRKLVRTQSLMTLRKIAGTPFGIANVLGIPPVTVTRWYRIPKKYIARLAKHYGIHPSTLNDAS